MTYYENIFYVVKLKGVVGQFDGMDAPPIIGTEVSVMKVCNHR
jgi:hypothetical protein